MLCKHNPNYACPLEGKCTVEQCDGGAAAIADQQHAMQSAIAVELGTDNSCGTPKHLRVGVNSALVETSVLARLLVAKGVFTGDEYITAMIEGMRQEAERCKLSACVRAGLDPKRVEFG